ncbi:MAG: sigma 54-interacting transcriptional regulator [Candidatus Eisenbacteria bacterium]|nr:sigma 54-interacting transcriptional regulator [Candidatus Eisenbacteria bacterium]
MNTKGRGARRNRAGTRGGSLAPRSQPPDRGARASEPLGSREGPDELQRALESNANVLVTGDREVARRLFRDAHPWAALRVVPADDLNRGGIEALRGIPERGPVILFIDRLERLEPWTQVALLDLLESPMEGPPGGRIRRVISACGETLPALVARGRFCRPLYLRLSTLHVHVPESSGTNGARSASGAGDRAAVSRSPGGAR